MLYSGAMRRGAALLCLVALSFDHAAFAQSRPRAASRSKPATVKEPSAPTQLVLELSLPVPEGLVVKRDGIIVSTDMFGVPLPIAPGDHVLRVETADNGAREEPFTIAKGESKTITLEYPTAPATVTPAEPTREAAPVSRPTGAVAAQGASEPAVVERPSAAAGKPAASDSAPAAGSSRALIWTAFGVGVAGIAVGSIAGVLTLGKTDTIDSECPNHVCTLAGRDAVDSAQTTGLVSTIGFGLAAAGVATGMVLWLSSSSSSSSSRSAGAHARIVATGTGALVEGTW